MVHLSIDLGSGALLVGECVIAPLDRPAFLNAISSHDIRFTDSTRNDGWPSYGLPVEFLGEKFALTVTFRAEQLHSVWMAWHGGMTSSKGWDTTEQELIADKNSLTRRIATCIGRGPEEKEYSHNRFFFAWGYISAAASLKSVMATIGFGWNKTAQQAEPA